MLLSSVLSAGVGLAVLAAAPAGVPAAADTFEMPAPAAVSSPPNTRGMPGERVLAGHWLGGDLGVPIHSTAGTWYLYGDSLTAKGRDGAVQMLPSTALFAPAGKGDSLLQVQYRNRAGEITSSPLPGNKFKKQWPSSAVMVRDSNKGSTVLVAATTITVTGDHMWAFHASGATVHTMKLATGKDGTAPTTRIKQSTPAPQRTGGKLPPIQWGSASIRDKKTLYLFGSAEMSGRKEMYLASMPLGRAHQVTAWRYWDGASWVRDIDASAPVIGAGYDLPNVFSIAQHPHGGLLLVAKQGEGLGRDVVYSTAARPAGPWSEPAQLFDAAPDGDMWRYGAIITNLTGDTVTVSVSKNVIAAQGLRRVLANPAKRYRPEYITVPLPAPAGS